MNTRFLFSYLRGLFNIGIITAGLVASVYLVQRETSFLPRATGEAAELEVNLNAVLPSTDSWANYAQGGEERGGMIASVQDQVANLKPKYIRIDHIYDFYDVVNKDGNNITYDWSKLDAEVDAILATGAKPFLALSYMPAAISSGSEVDLPANWSDWENLVRRTIEHYSGPSGYNLDDVYYEVWNEPDLFGDFKLYGGKNYLSLYSHTVNAANSATGVKTFKIGGPATAELYPNWLNDFLDYVDKNNLRLDFYSWHRYSEQVEVYNEDVNFIRQSMAQHPKFSGLELIISEMGISSENDVAYDTGLSAIQTLATITQVEGLVDKAFTFELKDGASKQQFWGRWGLLTHQMHGEPVPKMRYHALEFANRMLGGQRLAVSGEGSWVKAMAMQIDNTPTLLVVNYDPNNKHYETVPITFKNVPSEFILRRTDFLGGTKEQFVVATASDWKTDELFSPNSAAIFEIVPK